MTSNYSAEELADITAYIDDLVSEIGEGYYDTELRRIARACFKRRGTLQKGVGVRDDVDALQQSQVDSTNSDAVVNSDPAPSTAQSDDWWAGTYPMGSYRVAPGLVARLVEPAPRKRVGDAAFRYDGTRYYRNFVEEHLIEVNGMLCKITRIVVPNSRKIEVEAVHGPVHQIGKRFLLSRIRTMRHLVHQTAKHSAHLAQSNPVAATTNHVVVTKLS